MPIMLNRFKSLLALPVRPLVLSSQKQTQRVVSTATSSREIFKNLQETPLGVNIMSNNTPQHTEYSRKDFLSAKPSHLQTLQRNSADFNKIKTIFSSIVSKLHGINHGRNISLNFATLSKAITHAENESRLIKVLYPLSLSSLDLRPWGEIRSRLLSHPMFKQPARFDEQCYFIMSNPSKLGVEFHHDAELVNQHTDYLFQRNRKTVSKEECYQDTLNELTDALSEGKYQETIKNMRRSIDLYEQAKQVEENSNLRMRENQRMRRWVG
jgi:hypothetical protein